MNPWFHEHLLKGEPTPSLSTHSKIYSDCSSLQCNDKALLQISFVTLTNFPYLKNDFLYLLKFLLLPLSGYLLSITTLLSKMLCFFSVLSFYFCKFSLFSLGSNTLYLSLSQHTLSVDLLRYLYFHLKIYVDSHTDQCQITSQLLLNSTLYTLEITSIANLNIFFRVGCLGDLYCRWFYSLSSIYSQISCLN